MKIVKKQKGVRLPMLSELMLSDCWDRTFEFEGHTYAVIAKGDSCYTALSVSRTDMLPCFNLHSRTIRAIGQHEPVRPLHTEVHTNPNYHEQS